MNGVRSKQSDHGKWIYCSVRRI